MKTLLALFFFLASTLMMLAQTEIEYFTMNLPGNEGIYFNALTIDSIYDKSKTESVVSLHLEVVGLTTQTPINADIEIYLDSDFIKDYSGKVENGEFNIDLKDFGWYIISLSSPGYFETSDTIWVISEKRKVINRDLYMAPVEIGMNMTQNNIKFNFDKTSLSEQSLAELDKEAIFFNKNPNVVFEIAGHTDSDGPKDYNLLLSQRRAEAVVNYLVSQGVERSQLIARGYGDTKPVNGNETKSDKANNRRVEFKVLTLESSLVHQQRIENSQTKASKSLKLESLVSSPNKNLFITSVLKSVDKKKEKNYQY